MAATIRPGRDTDADAFIDLIGGCWAEYPGCVMDVDGENPELRALATYYAGKGGALWAAEEAGRLIGMVATRPLDDGAWEICRVYVARAARGTGLAHRLLDTAEAHARTQGAERLDLWSDTRFDAAHRFYEKRGYLRRGPVRVLGDLSNSIEFHYSRPVRGLAVEALDVAAAASAGSALSALSLACAAAGEGALTAEPQRIAAFWRRAASDVAAGERRLLIGWAEGEPCGVVLLDLAMPPRQAHRAALALLLVHPGARRRGLGRRLLAAAEAEARRAGRELLTFEAPADGAGEAFARASGCIEAGRIPDWERPSDGAALARAFFYKPLV
jgi:GNAT superfamily N-acetyltransferase